MKSQKQQLLEELKKNMFSTNPRDSFENGNNNGLSIAIDLVNEILTDEPEVDHSIDLLREDSILDAFEKFIKKWCGSHYAHLHDNDENDGQFMRDKIEALLVKKKKYKPIEKINYADEVLRILQCRDGNVNGESYLENNVLNLITKLNEVIVKVNKLAEEKG